MPKNKSKTRNGSNSFSASFDGAQDGVDPVAVTLGESEQHLCASPRSVHAPTPTTVGVNGIGATPERSHCLVIYTGGTFGMVPDENGVLHPSSGFLEKKISEMDEFQFENMPRVTVSEWANPIDSSDMCPDDWSKIAREIEAKYWDYDGFVVLQGTDTMAYTASALSFMLEYLGKPVVISGAMIPLHFPHSDARRNLIMSVMCAASLAIPEVCIYSNNKLLRGNRTTKVANMSVDAFHSPNFPSLAVTGVEAIVDQPLILPYPRSRFRVENLRVSLGSGFCANMSVDAFHSPNFPSLAVTGVEAIVDQPLILPYPRSRFRVFTNLTAKICVFHLVPGFDEECIEAYIERHNASQSKDKRKALVFALYGTGNAPLHKDGFLRLVKMAIDADIPVTITSQCVQGRTQLDTYATGVNLLNMGVITSLDMTIEACVAKLAYLMGKGFEGKNLKTKMETDLRGELSIVDAVANGEEISRTRQYRKTVVRSFASH
ncbi:Asparaginase [Phytophthora palmivora]|uniref:asparaginase n=1 Tax=Phytophthora palmivora TaxID=4796 RepID=A0A2P4XLG3_9STRA|nr:Asparaginase [Phytophthora palmivora]